jgi:hypothetical protein
MLRTVLTADRGNGKRTPTLGRWGQTISAADAKPAEICRATLRRWSWVAAAERSETQKFDVVQREAPGSIASFVSLNSLDREGTIHMSKRIMGKRILDHVILRSSNDCF